MTKKEKKDYKVCSFSLSIKNANLVRYASKEKGLKYSKTLNLILDHYFEMVRKEITEMGKN